MIGVGQGQPSGSVPLCDVICGRAAGVCEITGCEQAAVAERLLKTLHIARRAFDVRDHGAVRQQGRDLAASLKVTATPPADFALAKAHVEAMTKLRALKGGDFDRAFLQHEIDYHNAVIDAITKTLLLAIQNARLKDLVTKVAPAFVAHRDRAQNLLDHLK